MKRRIFSLAAVLLLVLSVSVQAIESRAVHSNFGLSFTGTTANCFGTCRSGNSSDRLAMTLILEYQGVEVESWSASGYGQVTISETHPVTKGKTYTLVMEYSINGEPQPAFSTHGTC